MYRAFGSCVLLLTMVLLLWQGVAQPLTHDTSLYNGSTVSYNISTYLCTIPPHADANTLNPVRKAVREDAQIALAEARATRSDEQNVLCKFDSWSDKEVVQQVNKAIVEKKDGSPVAESSSQTEVEKHNAQVIGSVATVADDDDPVLAHQFYKFLPSVPMWILKRSNAPRELRKALRSVVNWAFKTAYAPAPQEAAEAMKFFDICPTYDLFLWINEVKRLRTPPDDRRLSESDSIDTLFHTMTWNDLQELCRALYRKGAHWHNIPWDDNDTLEEHKDEIEGTGGMQNVTAASHANGNQFEVFS